MNLPRPDVHEMDCEYAQASVQIPLGSWRISSGCFCGLLLPLLLLLYVVLFRTRRARNVMVLLVLRFILFPCSWESIAQRLPAIYKRRFGVARGQDAIAFVQRHAHRDVGERAERSVLEGEGRRS